MWTSQKNHLSSDCYHRLLTNLYTPFIDLHKIIHSRNYRQAPPRAVLLLLLPRYLFNIKTWTVDKFLHYFSPLWSSITEYLRLGDFYTAKVYFGTFEMSLCRRGSSQLSLMSADGHLALAFLKKTRKQRNIHTRRKEEGLTRHLPKTHSSKRDPTSMIMAFNLFMRIRLSRSDTCPPLTLLHWGLSL